MSDRTCSVEGCDSTVLARGWCQMHYMRWRLHGDPGPATRKRRPTGSFGECATEGCTGQARRNGLCNSCSAKMRRVQAGGCTVAGCTGRANARGLCGKHYEQVRNGTLDHPAAAEILRDTPCSVGGCERPAYARGFCVMHLQRYRVNGDPGEAVPRRAVYKPGQTCATEGCTRPPRWRGYCGSHARRLRKYGTTNDELATMLASQQNRCAICRSREPGGSGDWHIDHDHVTGQVRGLLCSMCNLAIGLLKDDPKTIRAALGYVEHHRQTRLFGPQAQNRET